MDLKIIYDKRELRAIGEYIDDTFEAEYLTRGDYLIKSPAGIHAVIERKTLADYAASIIDGRINNKHDFDGLLCPVYYIIEKGKYSGKAIKKESIYKSAFKLSLINGIHPIFTTGVRDTCEKLKRLCEACENSLPCKVAEHSYFTKAKVECSYFESKKRILMSCDGYGEKSTAKLLGRSIADLITEYEGIRTKSKKQEALLEHLRTKDAVCAIYRLSMKRANEFMQDFPNGILEFSKCKCNSMIKKYKIIYNSIYNG